MTKLSKGFCSIVVAAASLTLILSTGIAQIPTLHDVPETLSTSARYSELMRMHSVLTVRRKKFLATAENFNSKCRSTKKGSTLADECAKEQSAIEQQRQEYLSDVQEFNRLLEEAITAQKVTSSVRIGSIANSKGDWHLITADGRKLTSQTLSDGMSIGSGARIITGPNSGLQILLLDESVFTIGADAEFTVDEFVFDPHARDTPMKLVVSLAKGTFRWITGKIATLRPKHYELNLAVGTVGMRGTDFVASVDRDDSGYIKLFSGELEITTKVTKQSFMMRAGNIIRFSGTGNFGQPERFK